MIGVINPPVGIIDEFVSVRFPCGSDIYSRRISVKGTIHPPIDVSDRSLQFEAKSMDDRMSGDLVLTSIDESLTSPAIRAEGDWEIESTSRLDDQNVEIKVRLERTALSKKVRYGRLYISGKWNGDSILVPICGTVIAD